MTAAERRRLLDEIRNAVDGSTLQPAEIARRSGVDKSAISRFLQRGSGLSVESVERIAAVLGLEIVVKTAKKK